MAWAGMAVMFDGLDLEQMADVITQIRQARGQAFVRAFPEHPPEFVVILPVTMHLWDTIEPIMQRVIPQLPYVTSVRMLDHIDGLECHRGWRVTCDRQGWQ